MIRIQYFKDAQQAIKEKNLESEIETLSESRLLLEYLRSKRRISSPRLKLAQTPRGRDWLESIKEKNLESEIETGRRSGGRGLTRTIKEKNLESEIET